VSKTAIKICLARQIAKKEKLLRKAHSEIISATLRAILFSRLNIVLYSVNSVTVFRRQMIIPVCGDFFFLFFSRERSQLQYFKYCTYLITWILQLKNELQSVPLGEEDVQIQLQDQG
jgi:hypothetical protein